MKNFAQMLKQAGELQARMQALQDRLAALEVMGQAGEGLVEVTATGKGEVLRVRIAPELLAQGDAGMLEDLVRVAVNDARAKADAEAKARLSEITGGLPLPPGFQLPF
jgi:DNA-binding YbaB/EbfC family protein